MRALVFLFTVLALPAFAAPEAYRLNAEQSIVGFTYQFQGNTNKGRMPVKAADMVLDLDNVPNSTVDVTLNAHRAKAGFIFATQTMRGPDVLFTEKFPEIRFRSTEIRGDLRGADVIGELTVRGVTRPVTMRAGLFRSKDADPNDRSRLIVQLTGSISRKAFGAGGFPGFVDDQIDLNIIARLEK